MVDLGLEWGGGWGGGYEGYPHSLPFVENFDKRLGRLWSTTYSVLFGGRVCVKKVTSWLTTPLGIFSGSSTLYFR